jgi:hypothetical protein
LDTGRLKWASVSFVVVLAVREDGNVFVISSDEEHRFFSIQIQMTRPVVEVLSSSDILPLITPPKTEGAALKNLPLAVFSGTKEKENIRSFSCESFCYGRK